MGIYDRDYLRHREPLRPRAAGRFLGFLRTWSVTTWLIAACVAVFVIDFYFVPQRSGYWRPVLVSARVPPHVEQVGGHQFVQVPEWMPIQWAKAHPDQVPGPGEDQLDRQAGRTFTRKVYDISATPPEPVGTFEYQWMPPLERWLHFSTTLAVRKVEVWRLIGFQFLHAGPFHLIVNMVALFFFGPLVERYLGAKRYLAFYLLCGICGALFYLVLNLLGYVVAIYTHGPVAVPWLLFNSPYQPLVGASAGIFGVLMAGAFLAPDEMVALFFVLPMRLVTLAYGLVVLAIVTVAFGGPNAGGEAGHLGGAAAGFYFIRHPHHLHGFFDFLGWVDPTSHHYRRGRGAGPRSEVDRVLDKVSATGLASLSDREKRILREAAERN
jgi:membrane associated rhomboid family serine protease